MTSEQPGSADEALRRFPPVVYVPTAGPPDDEGRVRLEMVVLADGRTALFAYSAPDRLAQGYGADAPWVLLSIAQLQAAYEQQPYDLLLLDRRPLLPAQEAP